MKLIRNAGVLYSVDSNGKTVAQHTLKWAQTDAHAHIIREVTKILSCQEKKIKRQKTTKREKEHLYILFHRDIVLKRHRRLQLIAKQCVDSKNGQS